MERNQCSIPCKYRYEQELVRRKYLKEVGPQKISTILRLERQQHRKRQRNHRRGLRGLFASVDQHLNAAVIEQKSNLTLKNVQNEILIADDGLVINEANDLVVDDDDDDFIINEDDDNLIVDEDDLSFNADDDPDEKQVVQVNDLNQEQGFYSIPRHSPETQLKLEIALFIRQANMNKKNTNALLNLIRRTSTM
jgi:hypothetical protein